MTSAASQPFPAGMPLGFVVNVLIVCNLVVMLSANGDAVAQVTTRSTFVSTVNGTMHSGRGARHSVSTDVLPPAEVAQDSGQISSSTAIGLISDGTATRTGHDCYLPGPYQSRRGRVPRTCLSVSTPEAATPPAAEIAFETTNAIVGPARGSAAQAIDYARSIGALRLPEVERYIHEVYEQAPVLGFDPALLVAQSALETGNWKSYWWVQRLNPAGMGITGHAHQEAASPEFANGTVAARAQLAHMHAEVYGDEKLLPSVLQGVDPTYRRVFEAGWAGTVRTLEDLSGTWAVDPDYAVKIVARAEAIFRQS